MVALLCLTSVGMRFNGRSGADGPVEEDFGHTLSSYIHLVFFLFSQVLGNY